MSTKNVVAVLWLMISIIISCSVLQWCEIINKEVSTSIMGGCFIIMLFCAGIIKRNSEKNGKKNINSKL